MASSLDERALPPPPSPSPTHSAPATAHGPHDAHDAHEDDPAQLTTSPMTPVDAPGPSAMPSPEPSQRPEPPSRSVPSTPPQQIEARPSPVAAPAPAITIAAPAPVVALSPAPITTNFAGPSHPPTRTPSLDRHLLDEQGQLLPPHRQRSERRAHGSIHSGRYDDSAAYGPAYGNGYGGGNGYAPGVALPTRAVSYDARYPRVTRATSQIPFGMASPEHVRSRVSNLDLGYGAAPILQEDDEEKRMSDAGMSFSSVSVPHFTVRVRH